MSDEVERLRGELGAALAEERAAVEAADASRREVAALRLMLREVAATNATGIDYALRCQRERDEARAEVVELRALLDAMSAARAPASADELDAARMDAAVARADLAAETATRTALRTQESRISGILADAGMPVGDLVRGVEALVRERDTARAAALREAAGIARAHGGISAYYAIAKLAAEVEP